MIRKYTCIGIGYYAGAIEREGLVEDENIANTSSVCKIPKVSRYNITPKGQKLLRCWIGFLSAFQ
jgi:DNA-binding PadR family transcriptional regulator